MKYFKLLLILIIFSSNVIAQNDSTNTERKGRPDIPGHLQIDLGFNFLPGAPEQMKTKFFKSKGVSVYYLHEIRLGASRFSFNPGIGLTLDKFGFAKAVTLVDSAGDKGSFVVPIAKSGIKQTKLAANYVEIPLELRYHSNKDNFKKGLVIAVGGRIGYLYDSFTKIKYEENKQTKKEKYKESYQLNKLRYGLYGRIGLGDFSLFYYHSLSPLFNKEKGPEDTDIAPFRAGISIAAF